MDVELSPVDASFLLLERLWLPMHFGGLSLLDSSARPGGPITEVELRHALKRRFRRLPRLAARVEFPHRIGHPVWTACAPDFDEQVRGHDLEAPGDWPRVLDLVSRLHAEPLDRTRPLWELHLIDGLAEGRQALLMKVHHSVADGIGGMDVATALFDRTPQRVRRAHPRGARRPAWLEALQAVAGTAELVAGLGAATGVFKGGVGPRRRLATARLDGRALAAAKRSLGATLDDVLLEVVAEGLTRYFAAEGADAPRKLRIMLPVSTRAGESGGNHVTAMFFDLPLGRDPRGLVEAVESAKSRLRRAHEGFALTVLAEAAGRLPEPLQSWAVRLATALPAADLVVSDIPGPSQPYSLLGAPVEVMYPLMPLAPATGLSIAAIWIAGAVGLGVTADPGQVRDPDRLAAAIRDAAAELPRSGAARAVRRERPRTPSAARTKRRSAPRCAPARRAASA